VNMRELTFGFSNGWRMYTGLEYVSYTSKTNRICSEISVCKYKCKGSNGKAQRLIHERIGWRDFCPIHTEGTFLFQHAITGTVPNRVWFAHPTHEICRMVRTMNRKLEQTASMRNYSWEKKGNRNINKRQFSLSAVCK